MLIFFLNIFTFSFILYIFLILILFLDLNHIMVEPLLSLEAPTEDYRYSLCNDEGLRDQFMTPF